MTSDQFERIADAALLGTAKSAIPGVGPLLDVFKAIVGDNDAKFRAAYIGELHDHLNRLQGKVNDLEQELKAQGERLDEMDPIALAHLVQDFMHDVSEKASAANRDAIIMATARQFDPRLGPFSMRQYWLQRIRTLSDIELEVLKMHTKGALYIDAREGFYVQGEIDPLIAFMSGRGVTGLEKVSIPAPTATVFCSTVVDFVGPNPFLLQPIDGSISVKAIGQLLPAGSEVLRILGIEATWQESKNIKLTFR